MKILIAEYAVATGLPGTYQVEGRAMLSILAKSFERLGHKVIYSMAVASKYSRRISRISSNI